MLPNLMFLRFVFQTYVICLLSMVITIAEVIDDTVTDNNRTSSIAPPKKSCDSKYLFRSLDGTCNNLKRRRYGMSGTVFQRLKSAFYSDDVTTIRNATSGGLLPSPRLVSTSVIVNEDLPSQVATFLTMQWGQFVAHDISLTPVALYNDGKGIDCCSTRHFGQFITLPDAAHPECLPITVPSDDPLYNDPVSGRKEKVNCMSFVRSAFGSNQNGPTINREQMNIVTPWLDGSQVYGNADAVAITLRDPSSGKGQLKTSESNRSGRKLAPLTDSCCAEMGDLNNTCPVANSCFLAGDLRVRNHPLLTVMSTLWIREHNRIASQLFDMFGPNKTDEFYYQQARRIVIGEIQHITYTEYLPVLIGKRRAEKIIKEGGGYNSSLNPALFNEFSTAAFRMGHSQLKKHITLIEADGKKSNESYVLSDVLPTGNELDSPTFLDNAFRGLLRMPVQTVDNSVVNDFTSQLFKRPEAGNLGLDLMSLNLQRGRDHGLRPYVDYLHLCNGDNKNKTVDNFDELDPRKTTPKMAELLKKVYQSVKDVDLYIGGLTEVPLMDALVGPTFACIISKQFNQLKSSDRFFYSDLKQSVSFTADQLVEIQKVSLARIICDNSDGTVTTTQPKAFLRPHGSNAEVSCAEIPSLDLRKMFTFDSASN